MPGLELLARVRAALPTSFPLLLAGGIAERDDVRRARCRSSRGWLGRDLRGPALQRALNRLSGVGARFVPAGAQARIAAAQRPTSRLLSPASVTDTQPDSLLEAGALYAGETIARLHEVRPAAELVAALTP